MIDIRFCFRAFMNNAAVNTGTHSCVHVFSVLLSTFPGRNWGWDLISVFLRTDPPFHSSCPSYTLPAMGKNVTPPSTRMLSSFLCLLPFLHLLLMSLMSCMVAHTFSLRNQESDAGPFLNLRPIWSM